MEELEKQLEIQKAKEDAARMAEIKRQEAENTANFLMSQVTVIFTC